MNIMALFNALPGSVAQGLIWGVMAIGVYITFKVLDFADLTVDGSIATGGAVAVMMMLSGYNVGVALVAATIAGMLSGLATGVFHVAFGIPGILAGILTQLGLYSVNMRIMGKSNQAISVDKYDLILSLRDIPHAILVSVVFCGVLIGLMYCFYGTEIGRAFRATGNNEKMARAQGINTNTMNIIGLMLSNGMVGLAGGLYAQYQ
ncbi:MAG: ABC transporter permease, partial [Anaerotignum sp.]|nr:ABC transporter permease [Anaerotignum sp.]